MANLKEVKNELKRFGLSENQVLIYLTLIQHGSLRIQEIANLASIPRTTVADSLKILLQLGLVERIVEDNFVRINPYPLSSMKHTLREKLIELQTQMDKLDHLESVIESLPGNKRPQPATVRYYKGVSGARQLLWNTLSTKETVLVYSAWGRGSYVGINFYKSFVSESKQRQIKERVLVNPREHLLESVRKYAGTSIGRTLPTSIRGIDQQHVWIKGETFIYDNIFAELYLHDREINGFEIEGENFANMQKTIFETLWNMATPLTDLL